MRNLHNVSLVIATYNEEESIEFVLNELSSYKFFEILIVDNNSEDKTLDITNKFDTKILQQKGSGWGNAVLEGLNAASGEYITYMDADGSYNPRIKSSNVVFPDPDFPVIPIISFFLNL